MGLKIRIFNFLFNFQGAHLKLLKTIIILLSSERRKVFGTRKEDGIPLVGIKVLREREKRLLLDFIRDNLKQPKKRRKE